MSRAHPLLRTADLEVLPKVRATGITVPGLADCTGGEDAPHQGLADLRGRGDLLAVGGMTEGAGDGWFSRAKILVLVDPNFICLRTTSYALTEFTFPGRPNCVYNFRFAITTRRTYNVFFDICILELGIHMITSIGLYNLSYFMSIFYCT